LADILRVGRHVSKVPLAAVSRCSELSYETGMVDQGVAAEKQNGVGTPYIPPVTRRLKCRIDPEQRCMLPEHKPVHRGRAMIDLLAVAEPKPKP
jgi:hypothetical protein